MADTHEEQLLNSLLGGIAREDASLQAPHLEARVMDAAAAAPAVRPKLRASYLVVAAALVAAVLAPSLLRLTGPEVSLPRVRLKADTTNEVVRKGEVIATDVAIGTDEAISGKAQRSAARTERASRNVPDLAATSAPSASEPPITQSPITQSPITQSPITQSLDEFLPLMPITAQELTGSFQIVHVQLPRASLGALRSPLEQPNELVEADVLLGEDGMARAIRLSTSGSVYPWRSR